MRAAVIGTDKKLTVRDHAEPQQAEGQVRVRVLASAVNPVDIETAEAKNHLLLPVRPPFVVGVDLVGVVEDRGADVQGIGVGDRVACYTGVPAPLAWAASAVVPAQACARVPAAVSTRDAACAPLAGLCAQQALDAMELRAGQRVLVHGAAGAVGGMAVQLAALRGAHVIATARAQHAARLRQRGAAQVIDHTTERFERAAGVVDAVLDVVGGDTLARSWDALRTGGVIVSVKAMPPPDLLRRAGFRVPALIGLVARVASAIAARKGRKRGGRLVPLVTVPDGAGLAHVLDAMAAGRVHVDIDRVFGLDDVHAALSHAKAGGGRGRVLLDIEGRGALSASS